MADSPPAIIDGTTDMLVVAAPTDPDDPGTPSASGDHSPVSPAPVRPWLEDAHDGDGTSTKGEADEGVTQSGCEPTRTPPEKDGVFDLHIGPLSEEPGAEVDLTGDDGGGNDEDDDDDDDALAAWIGQDGMDEDGHLNLDLQHTYRDDPLTGLGAAVTSEGMAQ